MRILVISRTAWRKDNSFGNSYSSIFEGLDNVELAQVYLADGLPEENPVVSRFYRISEAQIIRSFIHPFKKGPKVGEEVFPDNQAKTRLDPMVRKTKTIRWPIFFYLRDIIWHWGNVDYDKLMEFVRDFDPDILFVPLYYAKYVGRMALMLRHEMNIPMVLECSLDVYSLKQVSFDPIFWLNRFSVRRVIRKQVREASFMYTVSDKLKKDYQKYLGIDCKVLYKIPDFGRKKSHYRPNPGKTVSFIFTGNVGDGRWKSLGLLAQSLKDNGFGHLDIYTATPVTGTMGKALNVDGYSAVHPPVPQEEVIRLQGEGDVLVHAESFDLSHKLLVRYSISTKIMDYLCAGRTILAIGPGDVASMAFLKDNDTAICANSAKEVDAAVKRIGLNPGVLLDYADKGPVFAAMAFNPEKIHGEMKSDLEAVLQKRYY